MTINIEGSYEKWLGYCFIYLLVVLSFFFFVFVGKKTFELSAFFFISAVVVVIVAANLFALAIKFYSDVEITDTGLLGSFKQTHVLWQDVTIVYSAVFIPAYFVQTRASLVPLIVPAVFLLKNPKKVKAGMRTLLSEHTDILEDPKVVIFFDKYIRVSEQ